MRRTIFILILGAVLTFVGFNYFINGTKEGGVTITLGKLGFTPNYLKIHTGETVTFKNQTEEPFWPASNLHPTHEIYQEFDPKQQIGKGGSWKFTFNKAGKWAYHDHLHPNFTGTIEVLAGYAGKDGKAPKNPSDCENIGEEAKQQCWDELLTYTVRKNGLAAAFDTFVEIYRSDSEVPKVCHGWAHILGKEAYSLFRKKQKFTFREETSYCGYGFFHGFIEQVLRESGDLSQTKKFCEEAAGQLTNSGDVYNNCLHGIGHGSVNTDNPAFWGDFLAMLRPGLQNCEAILTDDHDLGSCYVGAFNALTLSIVDELYDLKFHPSGLYGYCRLVEEKYRHYCFYEFTGLISKYTKHNFEEAIRLILREEMDESTKKRAVGKMQAIWMSDDIHKESLQEDVLNCRSLSGILYPSCFDGILDGLMNNGEPGREYIRGFQFCEEPVLGEEERNRCYEYIVGRLNTKSTSACDTVPQEYQHYCK